MVECPEAEQPADNRQARPHPAVEAKTAAAPETREREVMPAADNP